MADPTPPAEDTETIRARYDAATAEVDGLADGSREWRMRVPARPDRDSDLVISAALEDIPRLLAERDRLTDLVASATTYTLSGLPEDHHEVRAFQLTVEYSGDGQWSVYRIGARLAGPISLDEAMRFARETVPTLTVGGKTAADVLARRAALDTQETP